MRIMDVYLDDSNSEDVVYYVVTDFDAENHRVNGLLFRDNKFSCAFDLGENLVNKNYLFNLFDEPNRLTLI